MFCAICIWRAARSPLRRGDPTQHRSQQPLQWPSVDGRQTARLTACKSRSITHGVTASIRYRTEAFCSSPPRAFCTRFQAILAGSRTVRLRYSRQPHGQLCVSASVEGPERGRWPESNGWQVSGTVFFHSGVPFSVLSAPYSANGNGILNGSGPQFASVVPGVPALRAQFDSRGDTTRNDSVAESRRFRFHGRSEHWCVRRAAIARPTASSAILDATPSGVRISSGAICI